MGTGHIGRVRRLLAVAVVFVVAGLFAGQASAAYPGRNGQISFINDSSGSPQVGRVNPDGSDRVDLGRHRYSVSGLSAWPSAAAAAPPASSGSADPAEGVSSPVLT